MITLITNIQASLVEVPNANISVLTNLEGQIGMGDYININGFVGFFQNFTKAPIVENLNVPQPFGLKNQFNLPISTLNISY